MIEEPQERMEPVTDGSGDLIPWDEFKEAVDSQFFTDYDGWGEWATATHYYNSRWGEGVTVEPSLVAKGEQKPPEWATHVFWFNR